jgi:hypothetical protein
MEGAARLAQARAAATSAARLALTDAARDAALPKILKERLEPLPEHMNPFLCWRKTWLWVDVLEESKRINFDAYPTLSHSSSSATKLILNRGLASLTVKCRMTRLVWDDWDSVEDNFFKEVEAAEDEDAGLAALHMSGHLPAFARRALDTAVEINLAWRRKALQTLAERWLLEVSPGDRALIPKRPCVPPPSRLAPLLALDPQDAFVVPYGSGGLGANELGLAISSALADHSES